MASMWKFSLHILQSAIKIKNWKLLYLEFFSFFPLWENTGSKLIICLQLLMDRLMDNLKPYARFEEKAWTLYFTQGM